MAHNLAGKRHPRVPPLPGSAAAPNLLDFTVIGPAVNEVTRINGMCRALDQDPVLSSAFAEAAGPARSRLVGLGR